MALTLKGLQGTVSDTDMATQLGAHHAPTVRSAADYAVTAVAGARTVAIAAGVADSAFLKVTNDGAAAGNIALAPPASGGKWYAITLDRQWSPTNSATLRGDDLAVSDTNGTIPTVPTVAAVTAAAALPNQPGTSGSTVGQRQVLALVYVRAADTTLTIFDLRLVRTGAGELLAPNLVSLVFWAQAGHLLIGSIVTVGEYVLPSGGRHKASSWRRASAGWRLMGRFEVDDGTIFAANTQHFYDVSGMSRADLISFAVIGWGVAIVLVSQDELIDYFDSTVYRFGAPGGQVVWRPWDSKWIDITSKVGWGGATPLPNNDAQIRTRIGAGLVTVEIYARIQNTSTDQVSMGGLPFPRGANGKSAQPVGSMFLLQSDGGNYPLFVDWTVGSESATTIVFKWLNANRQWQNTAGQSGPTGWGGGQLFGMIMYTPAGSFS